MDTGFWYAAVDKNDGHHKAVVGSKPQGRIVVPIPVITEISFLIVHRLGVESLALFTDNLAGSTLTLEAPIANDYTRIAEILRKYDDRLC